MGTESVIAIHWQQRVLRVAAAHVDGGAVHIRKWTARQLPEGAEVAAIRDALSEFVTAEGLKGHDAAVVVDREQFEMRQLAVPAVPDDELPDIVRFQAKQNFTAFGENDVVDFIRLGSAAAGGQLQLLAATLSANELKSIRAILEPSRLKLKHLIPRPFATVHLIESELATGHHQVVVNELADETDLSVVAGRLITLTRSIRLPHDPGEKPAALIRELRRTIAASRNQPLGGAVERIVLVGAEPSLAPLAADIERDLKIPVRVVSVRPFVAGEATAVDALAGEEGAVAPLLGSLKLSDEPASHLIDFALPRRRPEPKRDLRRWYLLGGGAAAILLMALGIGILLIANRRSELSELQAQLLQVRGATKDAERVVSDVGLVDQWMRGDINWLQELSEISERVPIPDDVIVRSFNGAVQSVPFQGKISLSGFVAEADAEHAMLTSLQQRPYAVTPGNSTPTDELLHYRRTFAHTLTWPLSTANIESLLPKMIVATAAGGAEAGAGATPPADAVPAEAAAVPAAEPTVPAQPPAESTAASATSGN